MLSPLLHHPFSSSSLLRWFIWVKGRVAISLKTILLFTVALFSSSLKMTFQPYCHTGIYFKVVKYEVDDRDGIIASFCVQLMTTKFLFLHELLTTLVLRPTSVVVVVPVVGSMS